MPVFDKDHVDKIGIAITKTLGKAMQDGLISMDQLAETSEYILSNIDRPQSHAEMIVFIEDLVKRWEFFKDILTLEKGEEQEEAEKNKIDKVQNLIKSNQIDAAIKTAQG